MQLPTIFLIAVHAIGFTQPAAPAASKAPLDAPRLSEAETKLSGTARLLPNAVPARSVDRDLLARYLCALPYMIGGLRKKRSATAGVVRIGVLGDDSFAAHLRAFVTTLRAGRSVRVYNVEDADRLPEALTVLFVADVGRMRRAPAAEEQVLVVGVEPGFAEFGAVELRPARTRYEVVLNIQRLELRRLNARSSLLRHARLFRSSSLRAPGKGSRG